jgi:SAM-dependent methyltransferase
MEEHIYPHLYNIEKRHWYFAARQVILLRYINARLATSEATSILDVGCGTGAILELLSQRYQAYGLDFSTSAIEFCRQRGLSNLFAGGIDAYPKGHAFDMISMLDVVEHVDDDLRLLKDARDLLHGGGALLITVPAFPSLWSYHDVVLHHKRRYTKRRLRTLVLEAGYQIEQLTFFNTLLFPVAVTTRWLAKLAGRHDATDLEIPAAPVNALLRKIFELESHILPHVSLPVGLSLLCLARKRNG